ncbi:hypothetical protein ACFFGH_33125 [Lysobacter korlensis]|uniref:Erythromycin esterase n=1 Tax=Lysobacter korlensis TaxID=553636 RepID=A0ABV6S0E0_9GAMM
MGRSGCAYARCLTLLVSTSLLLLTFSGHTSERDLQAVERQVVRDVCDRDLVLLGELPGHGEAVGFALKARIVQRLVERCGFDAVLFEAGDYDFIGFEQAVARGDAKAARLDNAIGGFWSNVELAGFRSWLFDQAVRRRLVVGGIDDQPGATSRHASAVMPALVAAQLPATDAATCQQAVARNLDWTYDKTHRFDAPERERLQVCARQALARYADNDASSDRLMVESLFHYFSRQNRSPEGRERDRSMHRILDWYRERLPKGSKVVVWTATSHAAREQGALPWKPLGALLAGAGETDMATIGFTALSGESGRRGSKRARLPELPDDALEARALTSGAQARYLNNQALRAHDGRTSRLFGKAQVDRWSRHFDGVVVVREERAPTFPDATEPPK